MGSTVEDMQVAALWQNDDILTVSVSGYINYLDLDNPNKPRRVLKVKSTANSLNIYMHQLKDFLGSFQIVDLRSLPS